MALPRFLTARPRFSVRTLLILVTLVGLYFGCWEITKLAAFELSAAHFPHDESAEPRDFRAVLHEWEGLWYGGDTKVDVTAPAPFVICRERWDRSDYSIWFFGVFEVDFLRIDNGRRIRGGII
ncbi:MAG: hypothetical protein QGG36_19240 [Pirellulaceae bacterium]|jgi:hypothetical protein|nr:hypothetical protein [Pirellulaceae bacterium]